MVLALFSAGFQSLPLLPASKVGPSGADSHMGGFVYVWDSVGLSNELSCEAGSFFCCCLSPQGVFNQWFEALFPCTGALGLLSLFCSPCVPPGLSVCECGIAGSVSHCFAGSASHSLPASCSLAHPAPQPQPHPGPPLTSLM